MKIQDKFDLTGRVAVVTGGVGLLGTEFSRTLAEAGASVVVVDLNASASQAVAESLSSAASTSSSTARPSIPSSTRMQPLKASLPARSKITRSSSGTRRSTST
jgi:NAD(P)-dependent dehydrogenase (short-subunit alcohol dehydrogenase family)